MFYHCILIVFSVFLFLHGFFPITKPTANTNSEIPTQINNISLNHKIYDSDIEKTIIVVIDALRLDFINLEYMPLTSNITKRNGCFNTVIVETPTVTLPRIKALTTGNIPQFADLVLNLISTSTEILQDSLIHSLHKKGKNIVFYGDDTWLKLFPKVFARHEGTNSFFVKDFKEVDDNVTRNVNNELKQHDWDMMILHYLGLDHIGHVYGPFSTLIPEKLKEMDEIIHNIYTEMSKGNEKFLLLITGDHGMRDSGSHGGSSYSERYVPLLAIGLQCNNGSLFQIDIPTNLAVLLGLNIPSTSIGQIRPNLLAVSLEKHLFALRYNNLLLLDKADLCEDHFILATQFHEMYIKNSDETHALKAIELYENCSNFISEHLIKSSVKQDFNSLVISILLMSNSFIFLTKYFIKKSDMALFEKIQCVIFLFIITMHFTLPVNSVIFVMVLGIFLTVNIKSHINVFIEFYQSSEDILKFLIFVSITHPLTFFSSSFIEEEHQFWYFFFNSLIVCIILSRVKQLKILLVWLGLLMALRFLRTINSTGDKWASYPDFSDWLLKSENYDYLQLFFILGLATTFFISVMIHKNKIKANILNLFIFACIFLLKSSSYENVLLGKIIWFVILYYTIYFFDCPKLITWILISSLLLKPYNVILIPFCIVTSMYISKTFHDSMVITLCHFWLGNVLYFAQGHSNSLASVDVSVGYIGLNEYQPVLVILQVLCHTYSLPVLTHYLIFHIKGIDSRKAWTILLCTRSYIMVVTCIITVIFRYHLFVWSVFAPKLFIESVSLMFLFIEFSIYTSFSSFKSLLTHVKNR